MNDQDVITTVRGPFADVRMTVPLDDVVSRGRKLRGRRRVRGITGAAALIGGAAATVALLASGGHPSGNPGAARLAGWTVTRAADGSVSVVVNQLKDPAGLQATLRADGIPVRVTFSDANAVTPPLPPGCRAPAMSDQANAKLQAKILGFPSPSGAGSTGGISAGVVPAASSRSPAEPPLVQIKPSAIPHGIGLYLGVSYVPKMSTAYAGIDLVVAAPGCTGS
jgi:hypothetical protein